ncbi:MAG: GlsB/YeaQ/YmgE family stress response membrane protein [Bacteroidetes bacterium]|nr:MAG: GlsB/YeaQ/YmgE family stress response membrane protein [Bacteroidota bacterium]
MNVIIWLLIGLAAGAIAKAITPQQEKGGWISSIIIGIIGASVGGWVARTLHINWLGTTWLGTLALAVGGSLLVLWIYHKFLADKLKLPL